MMIFSETSKKIAQNTLYQIIGKVISMSVTVLTTIMVTRFYGREGYGAFSLMQNWPALLFIIVDFGINAIATRELSKDFSRAGKFVGNIFLLRTLFSLILVAVLAVALGFFPYSSDLIFGIRLGLIIILTQSLFTTTNIIFQVKLRYDLSTLGYLAGYVVILGLVLLFSLLRLNIAWVNFSYVIGGFVTFFANLFFLKKLGVHPQFVWDKKIVWGLLEGAFPLGMMFIFSQINFRSDTILLSVLKLPGTLGLNNTESVATYSLAYKIFDVALVVPTFFMNSVYPVMVRHMMEGKNTLKNTFFRSIKFLTFFSVACGFFGVVFSPLAINIIGGDQFSQSVPLLQILISGLILYNLTQPLSWLIVTLGKQKYLPFIYFVSAVFNVSANYLFIPVYSFYASAVITHLSELLILILLVFFAQKAWKAKYA